MAANGHAKAFGRAGDDGLAVDGRSQGAAHAHIVQGRAGVVDAQNGFGPRAADEHLKARVALELRHAAHADAREGIHIAGQQGGGLGGGIGDKAEGDALQGDAPGLAPLGPGQQGQAAAFLPLLHAVGAGADGGGGVGGSALGLDDDGGGLPQQKEQVGVAVGAFDHHGEAVFGGDLELREQGFVLVGAGAAGGAGKAELHAVGGERLAVVKLRILAQVEGEGF